MHDYLFNTYLVGDTRQQDCFDVFAQYDWMATRELEVVAAVRYDYFLMGEAPALLPNSTCAIVFCPTSRCVRDTVWGFGHRR